PPLPFHLGIKKKEPSVTVSQNNSPELKSSYNNGPVSGSAIFSGPAPFTREPSGLFTSPMTLSPFPKQPLGFAPLRERHSVTTWCLLKYLLSPALNVASCPQPGISNCNRHPLEVSLLPPSLEDLYIAQNATISCLVSGMETPGSLEVSWNRGSGGLLAVVSREPVLQEDGTYSATSILRVCVEEWQAGEEFTCTVNQDSWVPTLSINPSLFFMAVVSLRAPSVYISPPYAEELSLRESATITCLASGFQPREILVTWTQQDRPVPQEAYTNIGPIREAGEEELYFIYSKLNVLASEWERGDTYACVVGHEGLPMTFIHRSVDKSSGKPTAVNVSVILSDTDVTCY
uniref:Ig-like domain-containing protein n=1 Tax=Chrysemys picta bellii TaxID=8478 RepID=A0A8C3IRN6_CHRPI